MREKVGDSKVEVRRSNGKGKLRIKILKNGKVKSEAEGANS